MIPEAYLRSPSYLTKMTGQLDVAEEFPFALASDGRLVSLFQLGYLIGVEGEKLTM